MRRKRKLMFLRKLRRVRDFVMNSESVDDVRKEIMSLDFVAGITIEHGWTTWVTITLSNGDEYVERKFWAIDSLKKIMNRIYQNPPQPHE